MLNIAMWKFEVSHILFILIGELIFLTIYPKFVFLQSPLTFLGCIEMVEFLPSIDLNLLFLEIFLELHL